MRFVGGVVVAGLLAAQSFVGAHSARAAEGTTETELDRYLHLRSEFGAGADFVARPPNQDTARFLLFSGADLWRNGGSAHGGMLWSPGGLSKDGFAFKILVAAGVYRYTSAGVLVTGRYSLSSAMAGWRFKRGGLDVTLYAGPDYQDHRLSPDDLGNRLRGPQVGVRVGGDAWYQPNSVFMTALSISASSIGANYWTRAAAGWHARGMVWIGPEVMALGGDRYHQIRAGIHATSLRTWWFEWSAGFGYVYDSDRRGGLYGRFGVLMKL